MSRLREQLGDEAEIVRRPRAYVLRAPGALVDLVDPVEFRRLERDGRRALAERRFQEASELLCRALRLWRGRRSRTSPSTRSTPSWRRWRRNSWARRVTDRWAGGGGPGRGPRDRPRGPGPPRGGRRGVSSRCRHPGPGPGRRGQAWRELVRDSEPRVTSLRIKSAGFQKASCRTPSLTARV
ncbi:BTAD domain-containing putative transcriptional regulator [Streptomyces massasporeus]|uniref:BTAD domain-containing putative transcriptional regulator n=1 Tax=Streptomyces massasporeus TaxID=67324 RepID=UPI0033D849F5